MLRFEPTHDLVLVREVMTSNRVYEFLTDDGSPSAADFQPVNSPSVLYLLAFDGETLLGLWMFVQQNSVTCEVHTCLLPGHGFKRGREAARGAAQWIWDNTSTQRIFTNVPECNRIALRFAESAGMTQFGRNAESFSKHGKLWDQVLLGISRPKENQCQQQ